MNTRKQLTLLFCTCAITVRVFAPAPPPAITLTITATVTNTIVITWPDSGSGSFTHRVVQEKSPINQPNNWIDLTNVPTLNAGVYQVVLSVQDEPRAYRLNMY